MAILIMNPKYSNIFWHQGVKIFKDGMEINAKSVMGIMMLAADKGSVLKFVIDGEGEQLLMAEIEKLFADRFDED